MKLALISEAGQQWRQMQERSLDNAAGATTTTVMQHITRTLTARSETTCLPNDHSAACETPAGSAHTQTIAIALGAGIPLICAAFVLVYLHQRHQRKQRLEDKNDPHKSLDFGMDGVGVDGKPESKWAKQRKGPEMKITEAGDMKTNRKDRGLSLDDMGLGNPYLLPQEVNGDGGSVRSMSRSLHDDHDPYGPVTFAKGDGDSIRSRAFNEKASVYSAATSIRSTERVGLVANASRMSQSYPKRGDSKLSNEPLSPQDSIDSDTSLARHMTGGGRKPSEPSLPNISENGPRINVHSPPPPPEKEDEAPPPRTSSAAVGHAAKKASLPHIAIPPRMSTQSSDYGDIEVDEIDDAPPPRGARTPVPGPHRRQMSTQTVNRYGPRAPMPKKPLPPPMPLKSLPTPGMLKDDTAIFNADDFAPPVSYRDRQAGRGSDSPTGSMRPYSPSVASHVPLADSMADLSPMPSPFQMRKSGTYTGLDFAPPSRIRVDGGGSDAGSIRSARSGISNMHSDALRAGAYRVSRLPPQMVGTRDDLAAQLKPSWDSRKDNSMGL